MKSNSKSPTNRESAGRYGIYDLSGYYVTEHAEERLKERFQEILSKNEIPKDCQFRKALGRCRKLGTNPVNQAVAYLTYSNEKPVVLITQGCRILTFLTVEQFETVMSEFGRSHWPRKFNRWLRRIETRPESE